eukprot:jgi/Botrbrau1/17856/Bobra.0127s0096.1
MWQALEQRAGSRVQQVLAENRALRREVARLDALNNQLQGYGLDNLPPSDLGDLVENMTQGVERIRMTVQLRRLAQSSHLLDTAVDLGEDGVNLPCSPARLSSANKENIHALVSDLQSHSISRIPVLRNKMYSHSNVHQTSA